MNFRVKYVRPRSGIEYVMPRSGRCLGREAAERAAKSREVDLFRAKNQEWRDLQQVSQITFGSPESFVRWVLNKQDEGLFRKSNQSCITYHSTVQIYDISYIHL